MKHTLLTSDQTERQAFQASGTGGTRFIWFASNVLHYWGTSEIPTGQLLLLSGKFINGYSWQSTTRKAFRSG